MAENAKPSATETLLPGISTEEVAEVARSFWDQALLYGEQLVRPWSIYQILIALAVFLAAHLLNKLVSPRFYDWMRSREGWPKWRYRYLLMIHRRMRVILFVALIWPVIYVMREVTWPSRSYLLAVIGSLAFGLLVITFLTRIINNGFARTLVRYVGWSWVTLSILGLVDEARTLLETIAIDIGSWHVSLWLVLKGALVISALVAASRLISASSAARIRRNEEMSPSMQELVIKALQVLLYGAAFFIGLRAIGVDLTGLAVLSGAIGVGLGFGLQKVVSNLVSGVIILLDKSVKPGDVISLGETFGWINSLGARYVSVVTRDGKEYLIPNEDLITGQVVNWSHSNEFVRLDIFFGTAYGDDPHQVRDIAVKAAASVGRVLSSRAPVCHIVGFGDSSVDYILRFWISDPTAGLTNIRGNVYLALWDAFQEQGISFPFPQREVRMLNE